MFAYQATQQLFGLVFFSCSPKRFHFIGTTQEGVRTLPRFFLTTGRFGSCLFLGQQASDILAPGERR
ncbi:MAG TPA: hypothetical protein VNN21_04085 [Dehalococcoidia bacterium]|nr:hypothetical protein [Dehalococcoidia bacterium]